MRLQKNHLVNPSVMMPQDNYRISFDINVINSVNSDYAGIFQFISNTNPHARRVPALWFYPASTKFHWVFNNGGGQQEVYDQGPSLELGRDYHIDLVMRNGVGDILVDGSSVAGGGRRIPGQSGTYDCKFYMAVPGYPAADAIVTNFKVTEL